MHYIFIRNLVAHNYWESRTGLVYMLAQAASSSSSRAVVLVMVSILATSTNVISNIR